MGVYHCYYCSDVTAFQTRGMGENVPLFHTVLMNPPFGEWYRNINGIHDCPRMSSACDQNLNVALFVVQQISRKKLACRLLVLYEGTRVAGIDMVFLKTAIDLASHTVYSLHKSSTRE